MNETCKKWGLNDSALPRHVGIVMDGNGRWAQKRKLPRIAGHTKGVERVRELSEFCGNIGVKALTIFAFSDENWHRPEDEVGGIMSLLRWYMRKERKRILENHVCFRVIGDRLKLSSDILDSIYKLEQETAHNTGLHLNVALSYSARGEIIRAVKKIIGKVQHGEIYADDISAPIFETFLDTAGLPPLDMFVRTSGELRVSNFLLWQMAYAEMFFEPTFWPDFTVDVFVKMLKDYATRERRFGLTSEQIEKKQSPSRKEVL